jgi:hypothetical protein
MTLKKLLRTLFQKDHRSRRKIISPIPSNFTAAPLPVVYDGTILPGDKLNPETGEIMGPRGKEPVRYGDWENKGRCWDF